MRYEKKIGSSFIICKVNAVRREYADAKGENFLTESLFLILILEQQTMINELIANLRDKKAKEQ